MFETLRDTNGDVEIKIVCSADNAALIAKSGDDLNDKSYYTYST